MSKDLPRYVQLNHIELLVLTLGWDVAVRTGPGNDSLFDAAMVALGPENAERLLEKLRLYTLESYREMTNA